MNTSRLQRIIKPLLIVFFLVSIWAPGAKAAMVGTEVLTKSPEQTLKSELQAALTRQDVRDELLARGVDPGQVDRRIAALTDEELRQVQSRINELPAGGNVFAVIGVVFLVLLILEIVGVINVFNKL
ncbi:MAG: PA2779 family protein [Thermodesulfobacteriota bacterium]